MIKIGYYIKNKNLIQNIIPISSYDPSFLLYELERGDEKEIKELKLDCLMFDFNSNDSHLLKQYERLKNDLKIKGICILEEYNDEIIETVKEHKVTCICDGHQSSIGYYIMLLQIVNQQEIKYSLHEKIENICTNRNLSFHLKGTNFVQTAILYYIENEKNGFRMKDVYDTIAKKYHTTSSRVEKNMRMAINDSGSTLSNAKFVDECYREWLYE